MTEIVLKKGGGTSGLIDNRHTIFNVVHHYQHLNRLQSWPERNFSFCMSKSLPYTICNA